MTTPPTTPATADDYIWAMLFIILGTLFVLNRPPHGGWHLLVAGVAFIAGAVFAFRAIVRR